MKKIIIGLASLALTSPAIAQQITESKEFNTVEEVDIEYRSKLNKGMIDGVLNSEDIKDMY
ncbi:hypothetical protein HY837_01625 [archaeon]|nr:hypothetical protein [archaeon]